MENISPKVQSEIYKIAKATVLWTRAFNHRIKRETLLIRTRQKSNLEVFFRCKTVVHCKGVADISSIYISVVVPLQGDVSVPDSSNFKRVYLKATYSKSVFTIARKLLIRPIWNLAHTHLNNMMMIYVLLFFELE